MNGTPFYKMSGSGNDFVVFDGRSVHVHQWSPAEIRLLCDRRNGVGADGLVVLTPAPPDGLRMTYWNADGSRGAMCGNAALCCGRLAVELQMVPPGQFCLQTDAGWRHGPLTGPGRPGGDQPPRLRPPARPSPECPWPRESVG